MPMTSSPITVKDSASVNQSMIAFTDGTNKAFARPVLNADGGLINPATAENQASTNAGIGAPADAAATTDTGTSGLIGLLKRLLTKTPALGIAAVAASTPVVLASDHAALPLPTGAATAANQTTGNTSLSTIAGNTGAAAVTLTSTPTVAGATHALNDVVGSKISLSGAARNNSGAGLIQAVEVLVTDNVTAPYDVFFFDTDPTGSAFTDDAALSIVAADLPFCCGVAHCNDIVDAGTRKIAQATGLAIPYKISASNTTLFAVIVARGSAAFTTANGVSLRVSALQA